MICTFGEIMLRISPCDKGEKIINANDFRIEPGGSESNVAIALSNLGNKACFLTKLPDNPLGYKALKYLRSFNVDTSFIVLGDERLGLYWTENGISVRPSNVIYDRELSAFSLMELKEVDSNIFSSNVEWFHVSGITPAISEKSYALLMEVLNALSVETKVSVDLNYRGKLWNWLREDSKKNVHKIMKEICARAFLITGNETDFQDSLGYDLTSDGQHSEIGKRVFQEFKNLEYIGISQRQSHSASVNTWSGLLLCKIKDTIKASFSRKYEISDIVDRVGTGDSFTAGLIHGLLNYRNDFQRVVDMAAAISALNHTTRGDASEFNIEEVEQVMKSSSGRIIR
jgi:2-dehydro-3-deoxygluconokinase